MKRNRNDMIQLGILSALGVAVLLSFVAPQQPRKPHYEDAPEVSVIIREPDGNNWFNTRQGMEHAAGDAGADLRFLPLSSINDVQEQEQLIRREAEGGTDVFIIAPVDPETLDGKLPDLAGNHIVISLESYMSTADDVIAAENERMGQELAQDLLKNWDGGTVLLINSSLRCTAVQERLEAARKVLEEAEVPVVVWECPIDDITERLSRMTSKTAAHYIMSFEHTATEKAAEAKESTALTSRIYGVGASGSIVTHLERGSLEAVAAWSDYAVGYLTVARAVGIYNGSVSWPEQGVDFYIVHREEIYEPDIQKLLFPVSD